MSFFAGHSGHGKTAILINLILDLCERYPEKEFHLFTLEESAAVVTAKMLNTFLDMDLSGRNERTLENYLKGTTKVEDKVKEKEAKFWALLGRRFFVHYLEDSTAEQLCEAIQWLHRRRNVGGLFVDYIQLLNLENAGRASRQEEMKDICTLLRKTAVKTELPLVFGAQFKRPANGSDPKESDTHHYTNISEAGDIERVAAPIIGLWNREFTKDNGKEEPAPIMAGKVLKWRGGPVGGLAEWNYNGNRKRIYPDALPPQTGGHTTSAAGGGNKQHDFKTVPKYGNK